MNIYLEAVVGSIMLVAAFAAAVILVFTVKDRFDRKKVDYIAKMMVDSYGEMLDGLGDFTTTLMGNIMEKTEQLMGKS